MLPSYTSLMLAGASREGTTPPRVPSLRDPRLPRYLVPGLHYDRTTMHLRFLCRYRAGGFPRRLAAPRTDVSRSMTTLAWLSPDKHQTYRQNSRPQDKTRQGMAPREDHQGMQRSATLAVEERLWKGGRQHPPWQGHGSPFDDIKP